MDPTLPLTLGTLALSGFAVYRTSRLRDDVEAAVDLRIHDVTEGQSLAANELHDLILWISSQKLPEGFRTELSERLSDIASHLRHDS